MNLLSIVFRWMTKHLTNINVVREVAFVVLFCHSVSGSYGQNFSEVFRQMYEKYKYAEAFHIVMDVKVFASEKGGELLYKDVIDFKKYKENYSYRLASGNDMLINEKYIMMVDRLNRQIIVNDRDVNSERQFLSKFKYQIDSLFMFYNEFSIVEQSTLYQHYRRIVKEGPIKEINFYIDSNTLLLRKQTCVYANKIFSVTEFNKIDMTPLFPNDTFNESNYLNKTSKNLLVPASSFSKFEIVHVSDSDKPGIQY